MERVTSVLQKHCLENDRDSLLYNAGLQSTIVLTLIVTLECFLCFSMFFNFSMLINYSKGLWKTGQSGRCSISKPINTKAIYNEKVGFFFFGLCHAAGENMVL